VSRARLVERAYRALMRLYPRRFRDKYGNDMVMLIREQCRDESAWRVAARSTLDLAIAIPTQHLEARMNRAPSALVPLVYTVFAIGGVVLAIVGGSDPASLVIGLGVAIGTGTLGILAWRRATPIRATTRTGAWWKFLAAGPCLIALVIVASGAGVNAWFLGVITVLVALVSMATGLVLGLAHLWNRRVRSNLA
jgi:hypothetical protein